MRILLTDFMSRLLVHIASSDIAEPFIASLPVMGRDGTLWDIQATSAAAGHVRAKTGTLTYDDCLHKRVLFAAKGLAGYVDAKSGRRLAFATYLANFNRAASSDLDPGQVLGEPRRSDLRVHLKLESSSTGRRRLHNILLAPAAPDLSISLPRSKAASFKVSAAGAY